MRLQQVKDEMSESLFKHMWIDKQTTTVEVRFVTYNGNLELFAVTMVMFEFNLGGRITKELEVTTLNLELDKESEITASNLLFHRWSGMVTILEAVLMMYVVLTAVGEFKDVYDAWAFYGSPLYYFASPWNYFDMAQVWCFVMCGVLWSYLLQFSKSIVIGQRYDWSPDGPLDKDGKTAQEALLSIISFIMSANEAKYSYTAFSVMNLFIIQLRFFKFARFQPQLSIVTRTFSRMSEPLTHFMLILVVLLFVMSIQAKLIYGRDLEYVSGWYESFQMLFLASLGEFEGDLLERGWMGIVFFYVFIILVFFVLVNFFLAIVMEAYDLAKAEIDGTNTVFEDMRIWYRYNKKTCCGCCRKKRASDGVRPSIFECERGFTINMGAFL